MIDRRLLPMSSLRAFESAAKHLHMGRAGEELGVTPGAVSHQVRRLEEALGVELFSRAHNTLALTPAGIRLRNAVTEGIDRILDAVRNLDPANLSGPLIIGCTQSIAHSWAARQICAFHAQYPTIEIEVREIASRQESIPGDIDIAICYGAPKKDTRRLTRLGTPAVSPVCSPTLISKHSRKRQPADILNYTLIHDGQVPWSKWLETHGVEPQSVTKNIHFPNAGQALRAATFGAGVALANALEAQDGIKEGYLVRLFEQSTEEEHSYYLLTPGEANMTVKAQLFEEWIIRACEMWESSRL